MAKTLNSKEELTVLLAIRELHEGTIAEIHAKLVDKWGFDLALDKIYRYVRRWKKSKAIAANRVREEWMYSLRDIPWMPEAQMIHVLKVDTSDTAAKELIDNWREEIKDRGYAGIREPDIRNYAKYVVTLEITDQVAGGLTGNGGDNDTDVEQKLLYFPRHQEQPIIPRSWIVGWFRDNARRINMTQSIKYNLGVNVGRFLEAPDITEATVIGAKGPVTHEVIAAPNRFQFNLAYPMHGTKITSRDQLLDFFHEIEFAPIRGFGANNRAFGGNVKLISLDDVN